MAPVIDVELARRDARLPKLRDLAVELLPEVRVGREPLAFSSQMNFSGCDRTGCERRLRLGRSSGADPAKLKAFRPEANVPAAAARVMVAARQTTLSNCAL